MAKKDSILSSPQEKANRLKRVRNMANLSRDEISGGKINKSTYTGWESAGYGGLSDKGARLVIERVKKEGVICSFDWLYFGVGEEPHVSTERPKPRTLNKKIKGEIALIEKHLNALRELHGEKLAEFIVTNDDHLPHFQKNDQLAGLKLSPNKIDAINGQTCIIRLQENSLLLKKIKISHKDQIIILSDANLAKNNPDLVVKKDQIVFVAPIILHSRILPAKLKS